MKYIGQFFQDIGQFFQDDSTHRFSAIRLVFLAWALGTLTTWGFISFEKQEIKDLPPSIQIVLLTLLTGKVVQKCGEKSSTTDSDEQEATSSSTDSDTPEEPTHDLQPTIGSLNGQVAKNGNHPVPSVQENATPATA